MPDGIETAHQLVFFVRMLVLALVDAAFLDTEAYFQDHRGIIQRNYPSINELWEELRKDQENLSGSTSDAIRPVRYEVYADRLIAAERPRIFPVEDVAESAAR